MKHIKTASDIEDAAKKQYREASGEAVKARPEHLEKLDKIFELTRQSDLLLLEISKLKGEIMGYMGAAPALEGEDGRLLVTWKNASPKKTVDWDGVVVELNIPPSVIQKHTSVKPGARTFMIQD